MNMNRRQNIKIEVEDLILAESATYTDQFMRPYVSEVKGSLIEKLEERLAKSKRFTPSILANIANQFVVPDYQARGVIEIPHGWSTRRGRFILVLNIILATGDKLRQVIMGYTNSVGFTTRNVDPKMEFFINNMFMLHETVRRDRDGRTTRIWIPSQTNDVLSDRDNSGIRGRGEKLYTMRPEDIYSALDAEQTTDLVGDVIDTRTTLSTMAVKSSSANRLGSRFMSRILDSRQKAVDNESYSNASFETNATAQGYASESYASDDLFLNAMASISGVDRITDNFLYQDLMGLDPDIDRKHRLFLLDDEALATTNYRQDDVNDLSGQEEHDRVAAIIGIAVPALMVEHGIHNLSFETHNQLVGGEWDFAPQGAGSLVRNLDVTPFLQQFETRLIDEVLVPVTGGNQYDIGLKLKCRAFGEIDFTMYWDGYNHGRYVIPTFTNALASPIVTDNRNDLRNMARNFNSLFDELLPVTLGGNSGGYNF